MKHLFSISMLALSGAASAATLVVDVHEELESGRQLRVALYDQEQSWLGRAFRAQQSLVADASVQAGVHELRFEDLPPGRYAMAVYLDANANGKLDRGMFGIPSEPYGFSNNGGAFGPPDFAEAAFVVDADQRIRIDLR